MSLKRLWELQELDLAIGVLVEKLEENPFHLEAREAAGNLERIEQELNRAEQALREQQKKLRRGELDLETITAEHGELHQRLYSGETKNVKELEQMEVKLRSVKQKQLILEDNLLGLMESMEKQEELIRDLAGRRDEAAAEMQKRQRLLDEELACLGGQLKKLEERRELLVEQIEPKRLQLYRNISERYQGRGVARVINDICQGCRVFISSAQRGFLYDPQAVVYCENCGRLLVRFAGEESLPGPVE